MPSNTGHFRDLLLGFIDNRISPEEVEELFGLIGRDQETFEGIMDEAEIRNRLEAMSKDEQSDVSEQISGRIRSRLMASIAEKGDPVVAVESVHYISKKGNFRWMAAASIILLLGLTGYFLFINNHKQSPVPTNIAKQSTNHSDAAPGGNKATLTLANGSKIILDSARSGLLAKQNGSSVIKADSGKLLYSITEKNIAVVYNTLTTPRGGQYQLQLPDGTKVWLNAASSITYPTAFNGKDRRVSITGEAYFEVTHNAAKPFRVRVNSTEIEDLGTAFNINAYSDEQEMRTTLVQGSVRITNGNNKKILRPGQQEQISRDGVINITSHADLDKATTWKNGLFNFHGADLETVLRQISRWYDIDVRYEGAVPVHVFEGKLDRQLKLSEIIEILGKINVKFRIEGKTLIVTK